MEESGDIFDPELYLYDDEKKIVYRREQFNRGDALPAELIVRDRRYELREITNLLGAVGLSIEWSRCVRAGAWDTELDPKHQNAKAILILCRKPG